MLLGSNITEEELRVAEDKFEETKCLTETAMYNLLENEVWVQKHSVYKAFKYIYIHIV